MTYFFDTSFFYHLFASHHRECDVLYGSPERKFTNEYVLAELARVLLTRGFARPDVDIFLTDVRRKCTVLSFPNKNRLKTVRIVDRSDVPVLLGAMDSKAVLVTLDRRLAAECKPYVQSICLDLNG